MRYLTWMVPITEGNMPSLAAAYPTLEPPSSDPFSAPTAEHATNSGTASENLERARSANVYDKRGKVKVQQKTQDQQFNVHAVA